MQHLQLSKVQQAMSCCLRGHETGSYRVKDFIFGTVDAFTQGLDPGVLLLWSLDLNLDVVDLWKTRLNTTLQVSQRSVTGLWQFTSRLVVCRNHFELKSD